MSTEQKQLRKKVRRWLLFFAAALVVSGITAFPLQWEAGLLKQWAHLLPSSAEPWIEKVYNALKNINEEHPFFFYGTDWLAFSHIVIATAFIGPFRDPIKNIWVIEFGMIACLMVFPLAFIAGQLRGIPFYWQLIDCSFGLLGLIPLYFAHRHTKRLELLDQPAQLRIIK